MDKDKRINVRDMPDNSSGGAIPGQPLKKQSRTSRDPWFPGMVPAFPFMKVLRPLHSKATPIGHGSMGVEKPVARGARYPRNPDISGESEGNKGIKK
jgi:hypothetical protein